MSNLFLFTEEDPDSQIEVVSSSRADLTSFSRDESTHLSRDRGVDFYDGDYEIEGTTYMASGASGSAFNNFLVLANLVGDNKEIIDAAGDMHIILDFNGNPRIIGLREVVAGTIYTDFSISLDFDKEYRCILLRDESIGTYGQLQCLIYDGVSLVDTLTLLLHEKEDFRYEYATQSFNGGTTQALNGYVKDFTFWKETVILRRRMEGH